MHFRVTARTILQLGAELISSDAIAFYELIKNAFDAGSKRVEINVVIRLPFEAAVELHDLLHEVGIEEKVKDVKDHHFSDFKSLFISEIDSAAPEAEILKSQVLKAHDWPTLLNLIEESNYIKIVDTGEGMSLKDLEEIYLTIGTRSRLRQREQQEGAIENKKQTSSGKGGRPILGEKGLGRLSTMRLGQRLKVMTSREGESNWNVLDIDWTRFTHESEQLIEEIEITPFRGPKKEDPNIAGTTISISGLTSPWTPGKLEAIARDEFSRLTDPFVSKARYPITLRYNGALVSIPTFDKLVFENAHAIVSASFSFDRQGEPQLAGRVDYKYRNRERVFHIQEVHLLSIAGTSLSALKKLGPFDTQFYWFNRRLLTATQGVADHQRVKNLVNQWAGGLMVYRDGFRVNPYGSPEDDWLKLDKSALASPGYKVNRRQIIGKVDISTKNNPYLVDQTNREGLRDSEEKRALVSMLQHVLLVEFKSFLDVVDKEVQAKNTVDFSDVEKRVKDEENQIQRNLQLLIQRHPTVAKDTDVITGIHHATEHIRSLMMEASQLAEEYEKGRTQVLHLAGLGLMVEILAHELNRATSHTLSTLADSTNTGLPPAVESLFKTLESQLKTLQKRLRILDPLSTSGRQIKESFDLISWLEEILKSHEAQFRWHKINAHLSVEPESQNSMRITAVKGMIVQIMENLISNSVYWLKQQQKLKQNFKPKITITVDARRKEIHFTDNGPGIDIARKDLVFQPFVTTKPPGAGRGLGLYISQEIAAYNGASLYLSNERTVHSDSLNTFVLVLEAKDK
jgi:signal transduction histidine kinase